MRLIDADALKKAIKTECNPYGNPTIDFESGKRVLKIIDNASTVERPQGEGEWITVEENLWNLLEDHYWYLIVHKDYGTPMKAKYHSDCPHFTFFDAGGEEVCYLFENKITHYMELPDIPTGGQK